MPGEGYDVVNPMADAYKVSTTLSAAHQLVSFGVEVVYHLGSERSVVRLPGDASGLAALGGVNFGLSYS